MEDPKVSVILPCHNSAKTLPRCLDSVVFQTHQNWEIMAVDDVSSDSTAAHLATYERRDPRIHALRNRRNKGAGVARNLAILRSSGEYIAFIDSDDAWVFCKLQLQLSAMRRSDAQFSFTAYKVKSPGRSGYRYAKDIESEGQILRKCTIGCSTVLHRRQEPPILMDRIKRRQDFCYWVKLIRAGLRPRYMSTPLSLYHIGATSLSSSKLKSAVYQWIAYRRFIGASRGMSLFYMASYIALNLRQRVLERIFWH